jgi:hypothetical protein
VPRRAAEFARVEARRQVQDEIVEVSPADLERGEIDGHAVR